MGVAGLILVWLMVFVWCGLILGRYGLMIVCVVDLMMSVLLWGLMCVVVELE